MVGFIDKPTAEEDLNQVSKLKILEDPLDPFFPYINDLSFTNSFLDFDSTEDWFEDNPNMNIAGTEQVGFRVVEKNMQTGEEESLEKSHGEEPISLASDPVVDGSKPIDKGSEPNEDACNCADKAEDGKCEEMKILSCCIEEEMGKVSLVGRSGSVMVDGSIVKSEKVSDDDESGRNSESVSASSTSSSSSSSSSSSTSSTSSSDDDNYKEEEEEEEEEVKVELKTDVGEADGFEEGEIRDVDGEDMIGGADDDDMEEEEEEDDDSDGEEMVGGSHVAFDDVGVDEDDEDDVGGVGAVKGPIKSKNELKVLPPVPPVEVTLQPYHQMLPVGVVLSVIGAQVIVEGVEKHNPLNEGSILWITESRSPLGLVDELFGPVKNPYYVIRYNSENEVPDAICEGMLISFVPEFADHVLNDKNLYKKGYDASGENDEEVLDEAEFSDDEKEAEYKRMLKTTKRSTNGQRPGNKKNNKKKVQNKDGAWRNGRHSAPQTPMGVGQLPPNHNQHHATPVALDHGSCSSSSAVGQGFVGGTGLVQPLPPMAQTPGFMAPSNGVWKNGMPSQPPQGAVFPNGFPTDCMPRLPQNHPQHPYQMPMPNLMRFQPQFDPFRRSYPNFVLPGGQSNFCAGPTYVPWPGRMGFQGQPTQSSQNAGEQGILSNVLPVQHNCNLQPPAVIPGHIEAPQQFNVGTSSSRGRKPYHRGGGRFASGRK